MFLIASSYDRGGPDAGGLSGERGPPIGRTSNRPQEDEDNLAALRRLSQEAVQADVDLGAQIAIPMHYGTFKLSEEGIDDPVKDLYQALKRLGPAAPIFVVLKPGERPL